MRWRVTAAEAGQALAGFVRGKLPDRPWSEIKRWVATAKVFVDGRAVDDPGARVADGQEIELRMAAPRRSISRPAAEVRLVFEDAHLVVVDKPSGVSSVPYEGEGGTALDLVRDAWRRLGRPATATPLFVVHRIDKDTSGLLCFAKTKRAEVGIAAQLRAHTAERRYVCLANGRVASARIESRLVADRGDGLRGSSRFPDQGKRAVTHVEAVEALRGATLCHVRLETGKTHQIRIHLAERGHPLVGERVYVRDAERDGIALLAAPRLMLHAATLGLAHPVSGTAIALEAPLPDDFTAFAATLRGPR
jgi:23S rRNA pseudouridine1911/1915/1917 synthase